VPQLFSTKQLAYFATFAEQEQNAQQQWVRHLSTSVGDRHDSRLQFK
jgi:hypothetical protein